VSLTDHLKRSNSPVWQWLEERFPETRGFSRQVNRQLRRGSSTCPIPDIDEADEKLVGTAIDLLLRACLRVSSIEQTFATTSAERLSRDPATGARAIEVEREAVIRIKGLGPDSRDLSDAEWRELCICCLVLARFEQHFRASKPSPMIHERLVDPLRRCLGLDDFIQMALTPATIEDLDQLGRATWEDHCDWRTAQPLVLNPEFELASALGGADGDLIVGRRLVDLKSTATISIVSRKVLWQLLGYALADTNDEYGIREVGVAALRWGSSIHWPLGDLMNYLAPHAPSTPLAREIWSSALGPPDLGELRGEFASVAEQNRPRIGRSLKGLPPRPRQTQP
jgi:hypothetical protein